MALVALMRGHQPTKKPWSETFAHGLDVLNTNLVLCQPDRGRTSNAQSNITVTGDTDTINDRADDSHATHQRTLPLSLR